MGRVQNRAHLRGAAARAGRDASQVLGHPGSHGEERVRDLPALSSAVLRCWMAGLGAAGPNVASLAAAASVVPARSWQGSWGGQAVGTDTDVCGGCAIVPCV